MTTKSLLNSFKSTWATSYPANSVRLINRARILYSSIMHEYADWRVGAIKAEKYLYQNSPSIVLTFDDYTSARSLNQLLTILKDECIRGVFFLQGDWSQANPALHKRIISHGHYVGNHTYSHRDLLKLTDDEVRREITRGVSSKLMRPPMGRYNKRIRDIARSEGQLIAYWTIDSDDWRGVSKDYMMAKITSQLHPGAVILFHLHAANTLELLPSLIKESRELGYNFLSFDEPFMELEHV